MVLAKVPITPQWNLTNGCVCTPDGGFLYVGSRSINYVGPLAAATNGHEEQRAPEIKVFHTRQSILSLDVDPGWPKKFSPSKKVNGNSKEAAHAGGPPKYFAALAQDNSVQIWDFDRGCAVSGHKAHFNTVSYMEGGPSQQNDHVLLSYMRNRNVLSVNTQDLVVYCVASNTYYRQRMFVPTRNQTLTVLTCSPYNEHIFAVGTNRGLVVIGDLQKMSVLYTLRGHESAITALTWCPRKVEALKRGAAIAEADKDGLQTKIRNGNAVTKNEDKKTKKSNTPVGNDDIFDIYDYDYLDNEFGAPMERETRAKESAADFEGLDKGMEREPTTNFDFTEACQSLKEDIDAMKNEPKYDDGDYKHLTDVTLADCQKVTGTGDQSSNCGTNESTEGSLHVAERCSSDEDGGVDGAEVKPKKQILHQAEVHAEQANDLEKKDIPVKTCASKDDAKGDVEDEAKGDAKGDPKDDIKDDAKDAVPKDDKVPKDCSKADLTKAAKNQKASTTESKSEMPSVEGCIPQDNSSISPNHEHSPKLLASASVDGHFWIWNTITGACCDNVRPQNVNKYGKNTSIHVDWLSSTQFLTNNKAGDLSFWSMLPDSSPEAAKRHHRHFKFKEETQQHFEQRSVMAFSISHRYKLLWTLSSHREISCEDLETGKLLLNYCCSSTNVSAMRECPDDMNKIALAFSDRRIGIIDISKMSPTNIYIENYISRVDASVLSLVWSPDSKKLAFGTLEGRVGVIHVESKKPTITFKPFCGKPIYSIDWHGDHIFVVCNDILAVYDDGMEKSDAHIIREVLSVSTASVRGHILYVGTQRGHIQVFHRNPKLSYSYILMQDLPLAPRYITEISWSPIAPDYVAVVANANNIHVLKSNGPDGILTPMRRIEIKNPKAANACVKWSNHNAHEFLTCGFDGGIRVWDLNNSTNDEKFLKQFPCPMTCGLFLPTDEQIVMCAGKSTSVELFDMRLEESVVYSAAKWKRSNTHTLDYVKWALKVTTIQPADTGKPMTTAEKRRAKRAIIGAGAGPGSGGGGGEPSDETEDWENGDDNDGPAEVWDMFAALKLNESSAAGRSATPDHKRARDEKQQQVVKKAESKITNFLKSPTTLLSLTTKELNKDIMEKLNIVLSSPSPGHKNFLCTKLFGTKYDAQKLLADELKNIKNSNKNLGISNLFMTQLNLTIREEILACIQNKELSEWHVAIAPTISYGFWQKCCQAFADQLLEQGYAIQAATYIIAMHRHVEAIELLMSKHYYKEALLIARIHLQRDDPLFTNIIDKWILHMDLNGNLTGSALLCVLSGQLNRGYEILAKVRNAHPEIERIMEKMKSKQHVKH